MTDIALNKLRKLLAHEFKDPQLLQRALTHRSFGSDHNERLEFLGDSVLGVIISEKLFRKFPKASEGELSRLRSSLVKGVTLAELARNIGLGECLRLGQGELKSGGRRRDSILADAFEAIIGALYCDAGMSAAEQFIARIFQQRLADLHNADVDKDAKTQLQELLQARKCDLPSYALLGKSGAEHEQIFSVACKVDLLAEATQGNGRSRREAEQAAAANAISRLQELS